MSRFKPAANTYVRPMEGWWLKKRFFLLYMIREGSAVFLSLYALVLLIGLSRLYQGEAAYNGWLSALTSGVSVLFSLLALLFVGYHSYTWFKVLPKTAPDLPIDPKRLTYGAFGATAVVSVLIFLILLWVG
jgi:fumarate reductase subunit C